MSAVCPCPQDSEDEDQHSLEMTRTANDRDVRVLLNRQGGVQAVWSAPAEEPQDEAPLSVDGNVLVQPRPPRGVVFCPFRADRLVDTEQYTRPAPRRRSVSRRGRARSASPVVSAAATPAEAAGPRGRARHAASLGAERRLYSQPMEGPTPFVGGRPPPPPPPGQPQPATRQPPPPPPPKAALPPMPTRQTPIVEAPEEDSPAQCPRPAAEQVAPAQPQLAAPRVEPQAQPSRPIAAPGLPPAPSSPAAPAGGPPAAVSPQGGLPAPWPAWQDVLAAIPAAARATHPQQFTESILGPHAKAGRQPAFAKAHRRWLEEMSALGAASSPPASSAGDSMPPLVENRAGLSADAVPPQEPRPPKAPPRPVLFEDNWQILVREARACWARIKRDRSHLGLVPEEWGTTLEAAIAQGPESHYQAACPRPVQKICLVMPDFGRTWQVEQTLPINLVVMWPMRRFVHFVLADLNPEFSQQMRILMRKCDLPRQVSTLFHFRRQDPQTDGFTHWHASVGKNTGHVCAAALFPEGIVINLDGDNFASPGMIEQIIENGPELVDKSMAGIRWWHPHCPPCSGRTAGAGAGACPRPPPASFPRIRPAREGGWSPGRNPSVARVSAFF